MFLSFLGVECDPGYMMTIKTNHHKCGEHIAVPCFSVFWVLIHDTGYMKTTEIAKTESA